MGGPVSGILPLGQASATVETGKLADDRGNFFSQLETAFNQVGQLQTEADQQIGGLLNGQGEDIHKAMIAVEKANLSFQLMMQVRNKIIQAYRDISGMAF
jgi:flagellar hook-basal body complex protein FliE